MLFRKSSYDRIGGHERIRGSLIEDVALAKMIKYDLGGLLWVESNKLVHVRMYPDSFKSFYEGWKKVIFSGTKFYTPIGIIYSVMILLWGLLGPFVVILTIFQGDWHFIILAIISALLLPLLLYYMWKGRGEHHWMMYLLYTFTFFIFICIVINSFIDLQLLKKCSWRGKKYNNFDLYAGIRDI